MNINELKLNINLAEGDYTSGGIQLNSSKAVATAMFTDPAGNVKAKLQFSPDGVEYADIPNSEFVITNDRAWVLGCLRFPAGSFLRLAITADNATGTLNKFKIIS
ncbi:MAG: hypothetical protein PHU33_16010 [Bacteroidales bacterium]|nr:hypothetical protein [Bacteroidales bacterium]